MDKVHASLLCLSIQRQTIQQDYVKMIFLERIKFWNSKPASPISSNHAVRCNRIGWSRSPIHAAEEPPPIPSGAIYWVEEVERRTEVEQHHEGSCVTVAIHLGTPDHRRKALIKIRQSNTNLACRRRILENDSMS